jgi:hypothetical protein
MSIQNGRCVDLLRMTQLGHGHPTVDGGRMANDIAQPARSEMLDTLTAQIVRFARPNIQNYDAHVVDLYQWVARGISFARRVQIQLQKSDFNSALDRISDQVTLTSNPKVCSRGQLSKSTIYLIFK